jgi:hypothetical protein
LDDISLGEYPDTFRGVRDMNRIQNFVFHSEDITHGFWKATQITDPAIYDFFNHMLHGPNKYEWARWQSANVTAEQLLFDGRGGAWDMSCLSNAAVLSRTTPPRPPRPPWPIARSSGVKPALFLSVSVAPRSARNFTTGSPRPTAPCKRVLPH